MEIIDGKDPEVDDRAGCRNNDQCRAGRVQGDRNRCKDQNRKDTEPDKELEPWREIAPGSGGHGSCGGRHGGSAVWMHSEGIDGRA